MAGILEIKETAAVHAKYALKAPHLKDMTPEH